MTEAGHEAHVEPLSVRDEAIGRPYEPDEEMERRVAQLLGYSGRFACGDSFF